MSGFVARSRESENFLFLVKCHLRDQVRGVAESVNAEPTRVAGFAIGTIAEHSGTKQRRNSRLRQGRFGGQVDIEKFVWETKTKSRVGCAELCVAPIDPVTAEFCST